MTRDSAIRLYAAAQQLCKALEIASPATIDTYTALIAEALEAIGALVFELTEENDKENDSV